jgi:very-short-patch-repair endonuclease
VSGGLVVAVRHAPSLCYAMQQCAVRWLHAIAVRNDGDVPLRDVTLTLAVSGGLTEPWTTVLAEVPARGKLEIPPPDLALAAEAFANVVERTRVDVVATVARGGEVLATTRSTLDVLAWNEWPGLAVLPGLLAAFVQSNHPALVPLLHDVAARLQVATGRAALDGYQSGDPARARAMFAAVHDAVAALGITYVQPPPSFEQRGQKVRLPEQVVGERLGTCLDLALLYAALLEHIGLQPLVVLQHGHAFVGAWLVEGSTAAVALGPAVELKKRIELGGLEVVEGTLACATNVQPFPGASAAARKRLLDDAAFDVAIDIGAARRTGIRPLPVRTLAFAPGVPLPEAGHSAPPTVGGATAPATAPAEPPAPPPPAPPKDRLEHWKQKLLDLSMWNRLLNFVETKKSVPLCPHDLEALEDRLQPGNRVRVLARPELGAPGQDPRDLELASARAGRDVAADYLADELKAGRLRSTLDADELDVRQVEIFRHARTSLEETGANTLYLAIGFLQFFESPQSQKPRRAPLLLLPLVVERLSMQDGYRFVLDDAEPRLNQTLLQFLQHDFDLRVPLGDTPPEGANGVDVRAVLDAFRQAVLAMPRWQVETSACIGFFSFTKYLMWLDLADRDGLLQSPVLRHLVERPGTGFRQDVPEVARERLDEIDPVETFCLKDADSSQQAAVLAAAAGRSFVLEGPPGTGKSQTITNLIAQALAHGKRVLFVAEKRAALEVVHRRLAEVGLGSFCLELHSSKSGPKAVLEQLRGALEVGQLREPATWTKLAADLHQSRTSLNLLVRELHRPRAHGFSVFAAMAELVARRGAPVLALAEIDGATPERVAAAQVAVERLAAVAEPIGVPCRHAWWGSRCTAWTPALAREVPPVLERFAASVPPLVAALRQIGHALALPAAIIASPSRDQLDAVRGIVRLLGAPSLPPATLLRADWRELGDLLTATVATGRARDAKWAPLAARWRPELLGLDLDRLHAECVRAAGSFVVLRWWRLRGPKAELARVATGSLASAAGLIADLEAARSVRADDRNLAARAAVVQALGRHWQDGHADWDRVEAWARWVVDLRRHLLALAPGTLLPDAGALAAIAQQLDGLAEGARVLPPLLGAFTEADERLALTQAAADALLAIDVDAAFGDKVSAGFLATLAARLDGWRAAVPQLRDWAAYRQVHDDAVAAGVAPLVGAHAAGTLSGAQLLPSFRVSFVQAWLDREHTVQPELARFRGLDHERAIDRFAELDQHQIRMAAEVVRARLAAAVPQLRDTQVASSELGILERELKKQKKHRPVRRLLAEIPGLLARLAPCMLMSPLSVAQFLARGAQRFDLVVFDEASQIPMWDAVGAIGRGASLVCVGDSRQLPPTSFFQRQAQGDEIGSDEIPEDLESVLDECGAVGLPRQHLDWHYRSRHESLIAFSNHHYYKNRLLTFPAPSAIVPGLGVRSVRVAGVYDRAGSQQNRIEAVALVAEVVARLRDPARCRQSLGVVTFSQKQQVLIEDLLDQERRQDPAIETVVASMPEPLFVKNLENVQGDERDVILFSICYGPDAQGRVFENYGPLNLQGGERRLNVAVTRARRELVVFTSVGPEQVANRTAAIGAQHLRSFLDYAQRGTAALQATTARDPSRGTESPFEDAVRDALVARGHEVHTQIGCSGYRIDLAIVDRDAPGRYLLGIECDGAAYHGAATARDRDRLRAAVLRGLGWTLHRVWSTDFWQDANGELARIEQSLVVAREAALAAVDPRPAPIANAPAMPPPSAPVEPSSAPPIDPDGPRPYRTCELPPAGTPEDFQAAAALRSLRSQVATVIAAEGPVVFDRLCRLVAAAWGLNRLTDRVRERVRSALAPTAAVIADVVWSSPGDAADFRGFRVPDDGVERERGAEELPTVEIANSMVWLLRQHQALATDDLAREAARCFQITRLGTVVKDVMLAVLERLLADGRLLRDGDVVRLA